MSDRCSIRWLKNCWANGGCQYQTNGYANIAPTSAYAIWVVGYWRWSTGGPIEKLIIGCWQWATDGPLLSVASGGPLSISWSRQWCANSYSHYRSDCYAAGGPVVSLQSLAIWDIETSIWGYIGKHCTIVNVLDWKPLYIDKQLITFPLQLMSEVWVYNLRGRTWVCETH